MRLKKLRVFNRCATKLSWGLLAEALSEHAQFENASNVQLVIIQCERVQSGHNIADSLSLLEEAGDDEYCLIFESEASWAFFAPREMAPRATVVPQKTHVRHNGYLQLVQ